MLKIFWQLKSRQIRLDRPFALEKLCWEKKLHTHTYTYIKKSSQHTHIYFVPHECFEICALLKDFPKWEETVFHVLWKLEHLWRNLSA